MFKAENIDLDAAKLLTDDDLKSLGLTLGARKKLLNALQAPAAAAPAAGAPAPTATAPPAAAINVFSFRWQHGSNRWPGIGKCRRIRIEDVVGATRMVGSSRMLQGGETEIRVYDLQSSSIAQNLKPGGSVRNANFNDADLMGDTVAAVGGDSDDMCVSIFSVKQNAQVGVYRGPNEGSLYTVSLCHSSSGAMVAAGASVNTGQVFLFDVATANKCGKIVPTGTDKGARNMIRDPAHPGCLLLAFDRNQILHVDTRAGASATRKFNFPGVQNIRMPLTPGDKFIATKHDGPAHVFDFGTGKVLHELLPPKDAPSFHIKCAAMYGNAAVVSINYRSDTTWCFADLSTSNHDHHL